MSFAPFDGLILDDPRPPVPGATAMLLHLRVERNQAKGFGRHALDREAVKGRAQACQELMSHGLWPATLRALGRHGLELGNPGKIHDLAALVDHFEAYLAAVEAAGFLEPDQALWDAVDREALGEHALWVERTPLDGPLEAGLRELMPARLRLLACLERVGPVRFRLATRRGDGTSGLFGSSQPLADWFLEGLENHGHRFPNELQLAEPEGWGKAPWSQALEGLFEGPMELEPFRGIFQRGLVEGPFDLLRHGVEQILAWMNEGIAPQAITVIHPAPQSVAAHLEALLAQEGVPLQVRGGLRPLSASEAWSPLWALLQGLHQLDPVRFASGLGASSSKDLRVWADLLGQADQNGSAPFRWTQAPLAPKTRERAERFWKQLEPWRTDVVPASRWAARLQELRAMLQPGGDPEAFFAPHALLSECWDATPWRLEEMLDALRLFLESARDASIPRRADGVRLLAPSTLLDEWSGCRAALVLDLSEGAWPAHPALSPDLDDERKCAINRALMAASRAEDAEAPFPRALQRFWLPRSEAGDTLPRAFQRDAYAFNKLLALTSERFVCLSPSQDLEGRTMAQGVFWTALEGAAPWEPKAGRAASHFRLAWEGHVHLEDEEARAAAVIARPLAQALSVQAPVGDRVPDIASAWLDKEGVINPSALQELAICPFRSLAKRVWGLKADDASSSLAMACGTLAHALLEEALKPFVGQGAWTEAFRKAHALADEPEAEDLLPILGGLWESHAPTWLAALERVPEADRAELVLRVEALLPNVSEGLAQDLACEGPARQEIALLHPDLEVPKAGRYPLMNGWSRRLIGLETILDPLELELGPDLRLPLKGKADRVERWEHPEGQAFIRIMDYKLSKAAALAPYAKGEAPFSTHLQLPAYAFLAEAQFGLPASAVLLPLRETQPKAVASIMGALAESHAPWKERLRENLGGLWRRALAGDFPPTPGDGCAHCALAALCGRPVDVEVDQDENGEEG